MIDESKMCSVEVMGSASIPIRVSSPDTEPVTLSPISSALSRASGGGASKLFSTVSGKPMLLPGV